MNTEVQNKAERIEFLTKYWKRQIAIEFGGRRPGVALPVENDIRVLCQELEEAGYSWDHKVRKWVKKP